MSYYMYDNGGATTMCFSPDGSTVAPAGVTLQPVPGEWNHQAFTLDATTASSNSKGYLNGALQGTGSITCPGGIFAGAGELHIGNLQSDSTANFPGLIDEVRVSKCVRSADWIKASHETVTKRGFASYAVTGADGRNPTLVVDVADGATKTLGEGDAVVEEWTRRIVKTGDGTLVGAPLSGTSVAMLEVEDGTVKLAASASPRLRLSVSGDGGATFGVLSDAATGAEWFAANNETKRGLSSIEVQGPLGIASLRGALANADVAEVNGIRYTSLTDALRAAGRGGTVTLLTNATAPASLVRGRTIVTAGHILVTYDDWRGTLIMLQ